MFSGIENRDVEALKELETKAQLQVESILINTFVT